jgi:hypothetical protein
LFTSEESTNLLQYRLFVDAPPSRVQSATEKQDCVRVLHSFVAKKELQQLWMQKCHDKKQPFATAMP